MKQRFPVILIVACAIGFVAGVLWLFSLRFEAGDVYPGYSSLRADPLGTMALYESLEKLPGLKVRRDFTTTDRLPSDDNTTYLHLAGSPYSWEWLSEETARDLDAFLTRGGRLVIAFESMNARPIISPNDWDKDEPAKPKKKSPKKSKTEKEKKETMVSPAGNSTTNRSSIRENWDMKIGFQHLKQGDADTYQPAIAESTTALPLPDTLEWHSSVVFTNLNPVWKTIYARGTNAVVIERQFGRGSIVMATDSYFLSNEAMWKDRHPDLLAWLIGNNRNIVFDEAHFGIMETSGVATLMRKYRLHGLVGGLLLLAALFIWKNSMSFVPAYADERRHGFVSGKDAAGGFVNLLRRNIPSGDVLKTCFDEWKKSCPQTGLHAAARGQQVQALIEAEAAKPRRERDPVSAYRNICETLKQPAAIQPNENRTKQ